VTPNGPVERPVVVRDVARSDGWWLLGQGLDPRKAGRQYSWPELPLQVVVAPARVLTTRRHPACTVEVDGRRAGYIGVNPLSGNLEYFLDPWARGGVGARVIAAFLVDHRPGDRPRRFHVAHRNERSLRALRRAFERLGWSEGAEFRVVDGRLGWEVHVGAGPARQTPS
jgi:hypothetical protein